MADETTSAWADIWAKAKALVQAWPKSASGVFGFVLGLASRLVF